MDFKERIKQALDITHCNHNPLDICTICSNNLDKIESDVRDEETNWD